MEFVLVRNHITLDLIWMIEGESGLLKEFANWEDPWPWIIKAGIKDQTRWARPEEIQG